MPLNRLSLPFTINRCVYWSLIHVSSRIIASPSFTTDFWPIKAMKLGSDTYFMMALTAKEQKKGSMSLLFGVLAIRIICSSRT